MLALQLVVGVGVGLLFPLLIYTGVAVFKAPPNPRDFYKPTRPGEEDQLNRQNAALERARAGHAKILFTVMAPAGLAAVLAGYFIGINAIGIGLLTGGIFCSVYGYRGYWQYLPVWTRFVSLLAGLLVLLFIGISRLGVS
jgi:hypothetical protein